MRPLSSLLTTLLALGLALPVALAEGPKLGARQVHELMSEIDARQKAALSDFKARVYMEHHQKGEKPEAMELGVLRRDDDDQMILLFSKPKSRAGQGYLLLDESLFFYDPSTGKWERRTERDRVGGTDTRRRDLGMWQLTKHYTGSYVELAQLGRFKTHRLRLEAKKGAKVPYPTMEVWVDVESKNMLKVQEYTASGKLARTLFFPKWATVEHKDQGRKVLIPREIRIFDEIKKGDKTIILIRSASLERLPDNVFTKAWLESKSR